MAVKRSNIGQQQARLKLKAEELNLRIRKQEVAEKLAATKQQLKAIGGRLR